MQKLPFWHRKILTIGVSLRPGLVLELRSLRTSVE